MMTILKSSYAITALTIALLAAPANAASIEQSENIQKISAGSAIAQGIRCIAKPACRKALAKVLEQATNKFRGIISDLGGQIGEIYEAGLKAWQENDRKQLAELKRQLKLAHAQLAQQTARNKELEARNKLLQVQLNQIYRILTALENNMDVGV